MGRFLCNINDIEKFLGSYIARKVFDGEGRMLLNTNVKVTQRTKYALERNDIQFIWLSEDEVTDEDSSSAEQLSSLKARREVLKNTFVAIRKEIMENKSKDKPLVMISKSNMEMIEGALESILNIITENPLIAASLEPLQGEADYIVRHSVNVSYLGLCLMSSYEGVRDIVLDKEKGIHKFNPNGKNYTKTSNLVDFGTSCFLHDIGKLPMLHIIGEDVIYKKEDEEKWTEIKKHPEYGHDMLFGQSINAHVLLAIKYHHENWDGSGYNYGIKGYKIHTYSRMIRIIDSFEAAISKGPGRPDKDFRSILGELLALSGKYYDAELVKYFVDLLLGGRSGLVSKGYVIK